MWRTGLIVSVILVLLLAGVPSAGASAPESPKVVLLTGFWFADGSLADDPRYMDWHVIPAQPVLLYEYPSLTAAIIGQLLPDTRARIHNIAFEAYPGLQEIKATAPAATRDGRIQVEKGDVLKLVCRMGDAMAAFVAGELVLVDVYGMNLLDQIRPDWKNRLNGDNQWLQLWTPEGKSGWAKFYSPGTQSSRGRWRIQPQAAGGSSNFNTIVFAEKMPAFQGLPLLQSK